MEYLFFDCEFAVSKNNIEKICEFGYVLTNENFDVIESSNLIINPNIKRDEWDRFVVKNIISRDVSEYEKRKTFLANFDKIKYLFKSANYIFGYSLKNDINAINCECKRYNKELFNLDFYDVAEFSKVLEKVQQNYSLTNLMKLLEVNGEYKAHDAGSDAINTMIVFKKIINETGLSVEEIIEKCPQAKWHT